ncbi:MAG TPA: pyridoxal-dependent decarboxylase, partial [Phycisphaerales bacterium]|nr:pyridoxal-dependent decarboxylase [Phycisphaerales bacterium]
MSGTGSGDGMPRHMTAEEFRRRGHEMVDWIAGYMERVGALPVLSRAKPGELLAALPVHAPERGGAWEEIAGDVERLIVPGVTHWQSPRFFGFFPACASGPGILGDLLASGLGVQGMLWTTSPACTELETRVMDWLGELVGLPGKF